MYEHATLNKYFILLFLFLRTVCLAQDTTKIHRDRSHLFNFGVGAGINYGGMGVNLNYLPEKHIAITIGIGFTLGEVTYNGGIRYRILPSKRLCPFIVGLYGYNGQLATIDDYPTVFNGYSIGTGIEIWHKRKKEYLTIGLLYPFHNSNYTEAWNNQPSIGSGYKLIDWPDKPIPVKLSIGYHVCF